MDPERGGEGADLGPGPGPRSAPPSRGRALLLLPSAWHLASLVAGGAFLLWVNRGQWFFGDEWDFLANRSITIGDEGLFAPHNEHWSTAPLLIYGLLFRVTGISSYLPYIAILVVAHLAVVHLVWRAMVRSGVAPWPATIVGAAFLPYGPGAENLLWAFQIGFVGSVAFGLAAILIADAPVSSRRVIGGGWAASVIGLTFSGITVPLVAASGAAAWMRRGFRALLVTVSVPALVYAGWFLTAGREGLPTTAPTADSLRVFHEFAGRSLAAVLSLGTSTPLVGIGALALSAGAIVLRRRRGAPAPRVAIAAAIGEVLLVVILGVGRAPFGLDAAEATRYVHIGTALLLPLMMIGFSDLLRRRLPATVVVAALAVPWGFHNASVLIERADRQAALERVIHEQLVAAGTLFDARSAIRLDPEPVYTPDLELPELARLLPMLEQVRPGSDAILRAALALRFSVADEPAFDAPASLATLRPSGASLGPMPGGCVDAVPRGRSAELVIPFGAPSSFAVTPLTAAHLHLHVTAGGVRPDYSGTVEPERGRTFYLNLGIDPGLVGPGGLVVRFQGRLRICPAPPGHE